MEIGRQSLSDAEFNAMWAELYQEFFALSKTGCCDASEVYNTIYKVCTSTVSYEDKLYWKIGDFLYNRCKEHRAKIEGAKDYVKAYAERFEMYAHVVKAINKLSSFLNECICGRKIDDFGYLLWERSVVQSLPATFYEDVYNYEYGAEENTQEGCPGACPGQCMIEGCSNRCGPADFMNDHITNLNIKNRRFTTIRKTILRSFYLIIPDASNPLLYYREKYEKLALAKLEYKYRAIYEIKDIIGYASTFHKVAVKERKMAHDYFLPESSDKYEKILSDCLLTNSETVAHRIKDYMVTSNINPLLKTGSGLQPIVQNDVFAIINPLVAKKNKRLREYFGAEDEVMGENIYHVIARQIGILDRGYSIVKKAYALYVIEVVNSNYDVLGAAIDNIYGLFRALDIFGPAGREGEAPGFAADETLGGCEGPVRDATVVSLENNRIHFGSSRACDRLVHGDFREILVSVIKFALQRIKPCFITRICKAADVLTTDERGVSGAGSECLRIFHLMFELVADKNEFMNVYQSTLRERLLSRRSCLGREIAILKRLGLPEDDRLYKMVQDMEDNGGAGGGGYSLIVLNTVHWGIEVDSNSVRVPADLMGDIIARHGGSVEDGNYKVNDKTIRIYHKFSKVRIAVNSRELVTNIFQYAVIAALRKPRAFAELLETAKMKDQMMKNTLSLLLRLDIVAQRAGPQDEALYYIRAGGESLAQDGVHDISSLYEEPAEGMDFCISSHLQGLMTCILKRNKTVGVNTLINESISLSKIETSKAAALQAIESLVEKGIVEKNGGVLDYLA